MAKIEEIKPGVIVQINCPYEQSHKAGWRSSRLLQGSYATVVQFHRDVKEAVKISYKYQGRNDYSHIHYKDLDVIDKIPELKKEAVLFDENNLDI